MADVNTLEKALEEAKKVLKEKENDGDVLKKAHDDLMQASYKIAEILYKDQQQKGQPGQTTNDGSQSDSNKDNGDQGPIDAEFKEKK